MSQLLSRTCPFSVALHPEGVDRNRADHSGDFTARVALHPEGVDRNVVLRSILAAVKSPSTRRAWIEMTGKRMEMSGHSVALHPEGVDRN